MKKNSRNKVDEIVRRRDIVTRFLSETYCLGKDASLARVMNALSEQGLHVSMSIVKQDITMYRLAYRYFHGGSVDLHTKNNAQRLKPLLGLLHDGFDSWEKIVSAMRMNANEQEMHISLLHSDAFDEKAKKMSECMLGTISTLQDTASLFVGYHEELRRRECELEVVCKKNGEQEACITELRRMIDQYTQELADVRKQHEKIQNEHRMLAEIVFLQKQVIERQKKKEGELQTAFRLMQEVFAEDGLRDPLQDKGVSDASETILHESTYMDTESIVQLQLPQLCVYCDKAFRYSAKFEEEFQTLSRKNQDAVVKSIATLSEQGPEYMGLRTNKVQTNYHNGRVKGGMMKSRVGRSFRLVWEIVDDALHIVGLFHKNKIGG